MDLDFCLSDFVRFSNASSIQTALQANYQRACQTTYQTIRNNVSVSSALTVLVGSLAFVLLFRKLKNFKRICDVMSKIPGPPNHFILGNAILVLYLDKFNFKYGTYVLLFQMGTAINLLFGEYKICKMWLGFKPFVILFTPEAVETVLTNSNLTIKADEYDFLKPWLGEGLVTSNGKKWKARRKMLTPTFHFKILQDFLPVMHEHCLVLLEKLYSMSIDEPAERFKRLDKYVYPDDRQLAVPTERVRRKSDENKVYDIIPIITLCTLDIICGWCSSPETFSETRPEETLSI